MCNRLAPQRSPSADRPEHVSGVEDHVKLGALQLCGSLGYLSRLGQAGLLQQELTWGNEERKIVGKISCFIFGNELSFGLKLGRSMHNNVV